MDKLVYWNSNRENLVVSVVATTSTGREKWYHIRPQGKLAAVGLRSCCRKTAVVLKRNQLPPVKENP